MLHEQTKIANITHQTWKETQMSKSITFWHTVHVQYTKYMQQKHCIFRCKKHVKTEEHVKSQEYTEKAK